MIRSLRPRARPSSPSCYPPAIGIVSDVPFTIRPTIAASHAAALHCHEVWQYNHRTCCQHLRGFQALCQDCHQAKHIFFVRSPRRKANLLRHLALVNKLTPAEARQQLAAAQKRQIALDQLHWVVNYGPYNWRAPQQGPSGNDRPTQDSTDNNAAMAGGSIITSPREAHDIWNRGSSPSAPSTSIASPLQGQIQLPGSYRPA